MLFSLWAVLMARAAAKKTVLSVVQIDGGATKHRTSALNLTHVPNYPKKLVVYQLAASPFWWVTGERRTVELPKRVKPWWFASEDGTLCLQVRYGVKVLEISKGKNTITIADKSELVPTLKLVKQAVEDGEMDKVLEAHASHSRSNFGM